MRLILFFLLFTVMTKVLAQDLQDSSDTEFSIQKFTWSTASVGALSAGSLYGLGKLWYGQQSQISFHLFNDAKNWMQMDKLGHTFSCYHVTRGLDALFSWTGLKEKKSLFGKKQRKKLFTISEKKTIYYFRKITKKLFIISEK